MKSTRSGLRTFRSSAVIILGIFFVASVVHAQNTAVDQVRARMDAGQYPDALRLISPALSGVPADDTSGQRFQLLQMRGECLLQTAQYATAANTFDLAVKCAPDAKSAAVARANVLLIRASKLGKYPPKTAGAAPIDILNADSRKQAFSAMSDDQMRTLQPRIDSAMEGTALPPMINLLPAVMDMGYLEFAGAGKASTARDTLMQFGARARTLMQKELNRIRQEMAVIEAASNSTVDYTRRGLYSPERDTLNNDVIYLQQISQTARDARRRAIDLGADGAVWEPIIADCGELVDRAQAMLSVTN